MENPCFWGIFLLVILTTPLTQGARRNIPLLTWHYDNDRPRSGPRINPSRVFVTRQNATEADEHGVKA